jgi:AcrR family transcriptional regulator
MADDTPRKPANRPSRRHDLIGASVDLLALQPWDMVTVADIVERAGMTPAAFYYHFSSREQLLQEVVEEFADTWVATVEGMLAEATTLDELCTIPVALLDEVDRAQQVARIFFLSAASAPLLVEKIHRDARTRLFASAIEAVRRVGAARAVAMAQVNGVALVLLCEMGARAHLSLDEPYRLLGPRRFRSELEKLARVALISTARTRPAAKKTARPRVAR